MKFFFFLLSLFVFSFNLLSEQPPDTVSAYLKNNDWGKAELYSESLSGKEQANAFMELAQEYEKLPDSRVLEESPLTNHNKVFFLSGGKQVLTYGKTMKIWDIASNKPIKEYPDSFIEQIKIDKKQEYLGYLRIRNSVTVKNIKTGKNLWTYEAKKDEILLSVAIDSESNLVMVGLYNKNLENTNKASSIIKSWELSSGKFLTEQIFPKAAGIYMLTTNTKGKYFIIGDNSGWLSLHDIDTGEEISRIFVNQYIVNIETSEDGKYVIVGSNNTALKIEIDLEKRSFGKKQILKGRGGLVYDVTFNDKYIVACDSGKNVYIWDFHSGELKNTLRLKYDPFNVDISPDSSSLIIGGGNLVEIIPVVDKKGKPQLYYEKAAEAYFNVKEYDRALICNAKSGSKKDLSGKILEAYINEKNFEKAKEALDKTGGTADQNKAVADYFLSVQDIETATRYYKKAAEIFAAANLFEQVYECYSKIESKKNALETVAGMARDKMKIEIAAEYYEKAGNPSLAEPLWLQYYSTEFFKFLLQNYPFISSEPDRFLRSSLFGNEIKRIHQAKEEVFLLRVVEQTYKNALKYAADARVDLNDKNLAEVNRFITYSNILKFVTGLNEKALKIIIES